jgi:hypothetical protein
VQSAGQGELGESMKRSNLSLAKGFAVESVAKDYLQLFDEICRS